MLLGVNIGKSKVHAGRGGHRRLREGAERLGPLADYLVVNVSSPNTPGLRALQQVETLRPLLAEVRAALDRASPGGRVPLLVKIDPDLPDAEIDAIADLALALRLDGIIATNTTVSRRRCARRPSWWAIRRAGGSPARRSRRDRWRCCGGCARGWGSAWC